MVKIKDNCENCNQLIKINIYQTVIGNNLRWSISSICHFCNTAIESDGVGFLSEDIRKIILIEEGEYQLLIKQAELNKVKVLKVLRDAFDIRIREALNIMKNFPEVIVNGTRMEMMYLQKLLEAEGIEGNIISSSLRQF